MQPVIQKVSRYFYNRSAGLLLMRAALGSVFFFHGYLKVADMSMTILTFDGMGLSPLFAVITAWLEMIGGIALILGIAPRVFAAVLGAEMLLAAILVGREGGLVAAEYELLLAAVSIGLMLVGSGKYALYTMECDRCESLFCVKRNGVCIMPA